jgi:hypothetical protein
MAEKGGRGGVADSSVRLYGPELGGEPLFGGPPMTIVPEPVRFPLPPPPLPFDTGPQMRALAAERPVARIELPDGSLAWLVTGFNEVREVLIDQRYSRALVYAPGRTETMQGMNAILADMHDPPSVISRRLSPRTTGCASRPRCARTGLSSRPIRRGRAYAIFRD